MNMLVTNVKVGRLLYGNERQDEGKGTSDFALKDTGLKERQLRSTD